MLPRTGMVSVNDKLVRFTRPGLTEEYSVSVDGVRQDFIIESPPLNPQRSTLNQSAGDLRVELALSGARAEAAAGGARLRLDGSGRTLAYSRLRVEDATGRELTARLEVLSPDRLVVSVADPNATYPVRIDPTFSDADWVSLNPSIPGANGSVSAIAADGSGNVYVAGYFTLVGSVPANHIAKWDGSAWSALGSGVGSYVYALAASGTDLYAGGSFSFGAAGGVPARCIAKCDGNTWSALGSGMAGNGGFVYALAADGEGHLFVGRQFSLAGTNVSPFITQANLGSAPTVFSSPRTQTTEAGTTLILTVDAAGYPPPAYQWYFNGTNLLGCTNGNLVLTDLLLSESGTYTVVVTNVFGAVTSAPVMVNVIAPVVHRLVSGVKLIAPVGTFWGLDYRDDLGPTANRETMAVMSLTNASQFYFDLSALLAPQRFYRAWQSGTPSMRPSLDLHLVPAITLTGNIGQSVRVDYINQFGPTDAWVTLDILTLTNTSQLYFDISAHGQPPRLYRVVPSP